MRGLWILLLFSMALASAETVPTGDNDMSYAAILARLQPEGRVYVMGESLPSAPNGRDPKLPNRTGKMIYDNVCSLCHSTGAAGSPRLGSATDWPPRQAKGLPLLKQHAVEGFNFMPPRGTCRDCNDAEIEAAIRYMLNHSTG